MFRWCTVITFIYKVRWPPFPYHQIYLPSYIFMKRVVISCVVMCSIAKSKTCFVGQGQGLERGQRRQGYLNASQTIKSTCLAVVVSHRLIIYFAFDIFALYGVLFLAMLEQSVSCWTSTKTLEQGQKRRRYLNFFIHYLSNLFHYYISLPFTLVNLCMLSYRLIIYLVNILN